MGINNNTSKTEISTPVVNGWDLHSSFLPWRLKAFIYHKPQLPPPTHTWVALLYSVSHTNFYSNWCLSDSKNNKATWNCDQWFRLVKVIAANTSKYICVWVQRDFKIQSPKLGPINDIMPLAFILSFIYITLHTDKCGWLPLSQYLFHVLGVVGVGVSVHVLIRFFFVSTLLVISLLWLETKPQ